MSSTTGNNPALKCLKIKRIKSTSQKICANTVIDVKAKSSLLVAVQIAHNKVPFKYFSNVDDKCPTK
uniref:Uncharacterized protein n=1 Tax=Romanomermis culicivorax TaxID=13658 RepID=A0A915KNC5_ROMCU